MTRRELAIGLISPIVVKMVEDKVLPEPTKGVGLFFEDRVIVPDGCLIFGWSEFQKFLTKTLKLDIDLEETRKVTRILVTCSLEETKVILFEHNNQQSYPSRIFGPILYFDKDFIALCDRLGFWHDGRTIEFTMDFAEGEVPKIVQTYQIMQPRKENHV